MTEERMNKSDSDQASEEGARPSGQVPPPGVPSSAPSPEKSDEDLLWDFFGPNSDRFIKTYRKTKGAKAAFWSPVWDLNWSVLFVALPWFFYRKLYLVGACILLIPVILVVVFPGLANVSVPGAAVIVAGFANSLYVAIAVRHINKVKALRLPPEERDEHIRKAGGTSPAGAVFGTLIIIALIALPFLEKVSSGLPKCDNAQVQKLATDLVKDNLSKEGITTEELVLTNFSPVRSEDEDSLHLCTFFAKVGTETVSVYLAVTWANRDKSEFQVKIGPTRDAVTQ